MYVAEQFEQSGYALLAGLVSSSELVHVADALGSLDIDSVAARQMLALDWCVQLARELRRRLNAEKVLPEGYVAVQCTYFEKSRGNNWLVPLHQDLSIPVAEQIDHPGLTGWSRKDGTCFVQPPPAFLAQLVAVRLHIDDCGPDDGALRIIPGSHLQGRLDSAAAHAAREQYGELLCSVLRGGAMVMRPLLLHSSSKASGVSRRRVLHFVFGPVSLPFGLGWERSVCDIHDNSGIFARFHGYNVLNISRAGTSADTTEKIGRHHLGVE